MAYLKGGSYVDGDFYVEGTLRVTRIANLYNEFFPYLSALGSSKTHYLTWFSSDDGGIEYSPIKVTSQGHEVLLALDAVRSGTSTLTTDNLSIAATEDHVKVINKKIRLDSSQAVPKWVYE